MKEIAVPLWALVLMGVTIVVLLLILWSVKRRRQPHLELEPTHLEDLVPSIAGLTQGTCIGSTLGSRDSLSASGGGFRADSPSRCT